MKWLLLKYLKVAQQQRIRLTRNELCVGGPPRFFAYASSLHPFPLTLLLCFIACRIHLLFFFFFSSSSSTGIPGGDFPGLAKTGKQSINS